MNEEGMFMATGISIPISYTKGYDSLRFEGCKAPCALYPTRRGTFPRNAGFHSS